ncbi:hypothetical protein Tsubulata_013869, partial [Turnera subulata]
MPFAAPSLPSAPYSPTRLRNHLIERSSKEVRLPDSPPISLDDQDVKIWGLMGREPQEILRLAAGLWYTERHDLIMALYKLSMAVVLDQTLEDDLVSEIQQLLEDLINVGLRERFISLIKKELSMLLNVVKYMEM